MSDLTRFIFAGLPVRGALVRLTSSWIEILRRRASNGHTGAYPPPLRDMLGEAVAAAVLMRSNIKFDGALVLQIFGNGPVKLVVAEVQSDLAFRATASVSGPIESAARLGQMVNLGNLGRCAITLDPQTKYAGQKPYQGVVPLPDAKGRNIESLSAVLEHYMVQSEQLDTTLVLAANDAVAAGLLIQRMPLEGSRNLVGEAARTEQDPSVGLDENYNRIAILAKSLKREELLALEPERILHKLFWQEPIIRFDQGQGQSIPRFMCNCSRERVGKMIHGLGKREALGIVAERGEIEVGCEFCGVQYRFDAVDTAELLAGES